MKMRDRKKTFCLNNGEVKGIPNITAKRAQNNSCASNFKSTQCRWPKEVRAVFQKMKL